MTRAIWNGEIIAESNDTVIVEGNHYFPVDSIRAEFIRPSEHHTMCGWKGQASYQSLVVNDQENTNAAWYYPDPLPAAKNITGRVAFWKGVTIESS